MSSAATTGDINDLEQNEKKRYDKLKDSLKDLKLSFSQNAKLNAAVNKCKTAGAQSITFAKDSTKKTAVKVHNTTRDFFVRSPLLILFIWVIMVYLGGIVSYIVIFRNLLLKLIPMFVDAPEMIIFYYSALIATLVLVTILFLILPTKSETRSGFLKFEFWTILVCTVVLFTSLSFLSPDQSFAENTLNTIDKTKESTTSSWENFKCMLSAECTAQKEREKNSENVKTQEFSITIKKPITTSYSFERLTEEKIYFKYDILSRGGAIKLEKVNCYLNTERGKLLSTIDLKNRQIKNDDVKTESGFYCSLGNISIAELKGKDVTIVPVLYYSANSILTQEIPFIKVSSLDDMEDKRKAFVLDKGKTLSSNKLFTLNVQTTNFDLPIFYSDSNFEGSEQLRFEEEYIFDFKLKTTKDSDIGKLVSSKIVDQQIPTIFEFQKGPFYNQIPDNLGDVDETSFSFNLKLNQRNFEQNSFKEIIKFDVESHLKKKSTINLQISDYEAQKKIFDNQTKLNVSNNTINQKYSPQNTTNQSQINNTVAQLDTYNSEIPNGP